MLINGNFKMTKCKFLLLAAVVALLSPQFAVATAWAASGVQKSGGMGNGGASSAAYAKLAKEAHGKCTDKTSSADTGQNADCTNNEEASHTITESGVSVSQHPVKHKDK
jgi:hypothetical protein